MDTENTENTPHDENPTERIPYPTDVAPDVAVTRQPLKVAHLVFGLLFLGIVGMATSLDTGTVPWSGARYLGPALLVVVGAIGLLATVLTSRRRAARI